MFKKLILLFVILVIFTGGCSPSSKPSKELGSILESLTIDECRVLECFFRTFFEESQGGYVLFGNKPLCIESFPFREEGSIFLPQKMHALSTRLKEGALLWKQLNLNKYCKDYLLFVYEKAVFDKWVDVILVNKKAFSKTVESNLSLFQYVLGPKVTPSELLIRLTDAGETFESVLHEDRVLIGILLGYGTQNSLFGSRLENINQTVSVPSFGFSSLLDEASWLKSGGQLSTDFSEEKKPLLPWFCCYDTQETKPLIYQYKCAQKNITKVLNSSSFLENILTQMFGVDVHLRPTHTASDFPGGNNLTKIVAQSIWLSIDETIRDAHYISGFYKGLRSSEEGIQPPSEEEYEVIVEKFLQAGADPTTPIYASAKDQLAYAAGLKIWDHFKKGEDLYSFTEVMEMLSEAEHGVWSVPPIDPHTDMILTHLHAILYQRLDACLLF
jgi:hypothetical protein